MIDENGENKKIKFLSFAKFQTIIFAIVGLIAGILYSFGGLIIDALVSFGWITSQETPGLSYGAVLAFGALIGIPVIFATMGFAIAVLEALLYNIFSSWLRGIEINFEKEV